MILRKISTNFSTVRYLVKQFKIIRDREICDLLLMRDQGNKLASSVSFKGSKYISDSFRIFEMKNKMT